MTGPKPGIADESRNIEPVLMLKTIVAVGYPDKILNIVNIKV